MRKIYNTSKGFTLIECLLYMGIFSILLVVTVQMFGSIFDLQTESEATSSVSQDGRYILNRMAYDLMQAQSVASPNSSTLTFLINGASDSYFISGGNLNFTNGAIGATDRLNSSDTTVSNLNFTEVENASGTSTVQIIFTLSSVAVKKSGNEIKTFETAIGTR